jgi:hypothetical protein
MLPLVMVVLCALARVLPHPANFAPVGAVAVFAGRAFRPSAAVAITLAAMFLSNALLSAAHGWPLFTIEALFVYAGFAAQALVGHALRARRGGAIAAAGLGSLAFFVLSNFGVWIAGGYGYSAAGVAACYLAAIPFFGPTLAGDLLWTAALSLAWRAMGDARARAVAAL